MSKAALASPIGNPVDKFPFAFASEARASMAFAATQEAIQDSRLRVVECRDSEKQEFGISSGFRALQMVECRRSRFQLGLSKFGAIVLRHTWDVGIP